MFCAVTVPIAWLADSRTTRVCHTTPVYVLIIALRWKRSTSLLSRHSNQNWGPADKLINPRNELTPWIPVIELWIGAANTVPPFASDDDLFNSLYGNMPLTAVLDCYFLVRLSKSRD